MVYRHTLVTWLVNWSRLGTRAVCWLELVSCVVYWLWLQTYNELCEHQSTRQGAEYVKLSTKLSVDRLSNLLILMMCPSSTPLSFMDWKACIVQLLRASTFISSIFFNSSVDPPRKEEEIFVRRHSVRCGCSMDSRWDSAVSVVTRWSSWLRLCGRQNVALFLQMWVQLWGALSLLFSGYRVCIRRVYGGLLFSGYRVCIRRVYGGDVKMKCEGLWLEHYLHINATGNYTVQCQVFSRRNCKFAKTGY